MKFFLSLILSVLLAAPAYAEDKMVGQVEFQAVVNLFSSPFGLAIGLLVTFFGIWSFFVAQKMGRGLILMILGVVITLFPTAYYGIRKDFYGAATNLGGSGDAEDFSTYLKH